MVYSVSTQLQYVSFLDTCFGFYKTIFRTMLTKSIYIYIYMLKQYLLQEYLRTHKNTYVCIFLIIKCTLL